MVPMCKGRGDVEEILVKLVWKTFEVTYGYPIWPILNTYTGGLDTYPNHLYTDGFLGNTLKMLRFIC